MRETGPFQLNRIPQLRQPRISHVKKLNWNFNEMVRYTLYLNTTLQNKPQKARQRWGKKEFQDMAKLVRSRNPNQCRIFHSKMNQIHDNLMDIFNFFRCNIKEYNAIYQRYHNHINPPQNRGESYEPLRIIDDISQTQRQEEGNNEDIDNLRRIMGNIDQDFPRQDEEDPSFRPTIGWFDESSFDNFVEKLQGDWMDRDL